MASEGQVIHRPLVCVGVTLRAKNVLFVLPIEREHDKKRNTDVSQNKDCPDASIPWVLHSSARRKPRQLTTAAHAAAMILP